MTGGAQVRLEPVSVAWATQVRQFEEDNRAFFAAHVSDRGDDYFEHFDDHLARLVAEHDAGVSLLYLIINQNNTVIGRVNILDIHQPHLTEIGFRVAEHAQGRGVATWGVNAALREAAQRGVRTVRARAATTNTGSQRVLQRCGFTPTGPTPAPTPAPAGSTKEFVGYVKDLA